MSYDIYVRGKITLEDPKLPEELIQRFRDEGRILQENPSDQFSLTLTGFLYRLYEVALLEVNGEEAEFEATVKLPTGEVWMVSEGGENSFFNIIRNKNFPDFLLEQIASQYPGSHSE